MKQSKREYIRDYNRTHYSKLYSVWVAMKFRCRNPNANNYKYYGAKGITVCEEWANSFKAFETYCIGVGYKEGLSMDRINSDGNYEPGNVRFITSKDNSTRAVQKPVIQRTNEGKLLASYSSIKEASAKTGVDENLIRSVVNGNYVVSEYRWEYALELKDEY